jgi:hypothetical protein
MLPKNVEHFKWNFHLFINLLCWEKFKLDNGASMKKYFVTFVLQICEIKRVEVCLQISEIKRVEVCCSYSHKKSSNYAFEISGTKINSINKTFLSFPPPTYTRGCDTCITRASLLICL